MEEINASIEGIILVDMIYPLCKLRDILHKNEYTFWGILHNNRVKFFVLDNNFFTPGKYSDSFEYKLLLNDCFVEKYTVFETNTGGKILSDFNELKCIPLSLEKLLIDTLHDDFQSEWRILEKFREKYTIINTITKTNNFSEGYISSEMESALYIYIPKFKLLSETFFSLLSTSETFRENLVKHILLPREVSIIPLIIKYIKDIQEKTANLYSYLDNSSLTKVAEKKTLIDVMNKIKEDYINLYKIIGETPKSFNYDNLNNASEIIFSDSESNDNNIIYLHNLVESIKTDCLKKMERIEIPINVIIKLVNNIISPHKRIGKFKDINYIDEIEGTYHCVINTDTPKNSENIILNQRYNPGIKIIPSINANLHNFSTQELLSLLQHLSDTNDENLLWLYIKASTTLQEKSKNIKK